MKTTIELVLAILSGLCGLAATVLYARHRDREAGAISAAGLVLCNIIWLMRL